jgi:hypothetical protein
MRRLRRAHQRNARQEAKQRKKFRQRAIAAGTAAAITLGAGVCLTKALAHTPDIHELPVSQDADADLLADAEEVTLGYCPFDPDQNRNEIPDGVDLAKYCAADINELPWQNEALPGETYKWWAPQFGLERCDICGAEIVMGPGGVVNPRLGLDVRFPFLMTLHYMEHGSFSYAAHYGDEPVEGRIDVPALVQALELTLSFDPNAHQLPVPEDADADMLSNREEFAIGYRPFRPDQNRNEIPDGVELAKRCTEVIDQLPQIAPEDPPPNETYKVEHLARGNENCCICGITVNMGTLEIVNPPLGLRVEFPILSLHYMGHGSFSYEGTTNTGRTNVPLLLRTIELRFPYDPNAHQLPVDGNDLDEDFLADSEELKAGYNLHDPDQDNTLVPDGIELARQCAAVVSQLPEYYLGGGEPPNQTYKMEHALDGLEQCDICGQWIHMGGWEIINPKLGLHYPDSNDPLNGTFLPDLALHYMGHGSFNCFGDDHNGRVDIPLLAKVLEMPRRCGDLGTLYLPADLNEDCRVNFTDFIELADKWLESTDPNQDGDTER